MLWYRRKKDVLRYERKEMKTKVKDIPRKTAAISGTIQWMLG